MIENLTMTPSFQTPKLYPPTESRRLGIKGDLASTFTGPSCTGVIQSIVHTIQEKGTENLTKMNSETDSYTNYLFLHPLCFC